MDKYVKRLVENYDGKETLSLFKCIWEIYVKVERVVTEPWVGSLKCFMGSWKN